MAKYTDLDEALANPQDVEDGRIHHPGATTPGQNLVSVGLPTRRSESEVRSSHFPLLSLG